MANQLRSSYDIIINGGGIVGFTLLSSILKSPHLNRLKVLLIEQAPKPASFKQPQRIVESDETSDSENQQKRFSNRVSSITRASRICYERLGVWPHVKEYSKDVTDIKVWNYDPADKIVFQQNQAASGPNRDGKNVMFSVVENNRLSMALLDHIHQNPNAKDMIAWNSSLQSMSGSPEDPKLVDVSTVNNETGKEIHARAPLILGCDGFKSKVRKLIRMGYTEFNLNKTAVVGTVKMDSMSRGPQGGNNMAYQRFSAIKSTVAALLPLDNEYSSFVISAPNDFAKHLLECDEVTFIEEFNRLLSNQESPPNPILKVAHQVSNSTCDGINAILQTNLSRGAKMPMSGAHSSEYDCLPKLESLVDNSRATFPLYFGTTSPRMIASLPGRQQPQIALLGDSSHRIHPLAGQGLNLGIQDTTVLVKHLERIARSGEKLSQAASLSRALREYEIKRQAYILPMSAGILSMETLFKLMPSRFLSGVNKCDFIKSTSVSVANGC